jgi:hypothetical protein
LANTVGLLDESFLQKLELVSMAMRRPVHGQLKGVHFPPRR